ncbi:MULTISPECIES: XRE family transcriptional regulator [unclassified Tabrizicola]|uniref:XRE family transcriptional regulator n=1 Tax=unclassified Tabrizicola TaxID=2620214 RepID=UPI001573F0AC|nr:XRE family transcriptional regulator [Tabrizicola sp. SY72]NTT87642.1 helix-turn-helix transcriptional regulator [Tabrizicola sp. SY72]
MSEVNPEIIRLDDIGQRIRAERERIGLSQTELGAAGGVQKNAQHNYEGGKRAPDATYLAGIARVGCDVIYILTGERGAASLPPMMLRSIQNSLAGPEDFAPIPLYAVELAAGAGAANGTEEVIDHMAFRRDWLRKMDVSPSAAVIARARGDSMAPTLNDGDVVLIDRSKAEPPSKPRDENDTRPPRIYALMDDGGARIKRIALAAPGMLAILSDNPASPPEFRPVSSVTIIGRVVWWGHTNRE